MSVQDVLLEILRFSAPALIVFFTSYLLLKSYLKNEFNKRELKFRESTQDTVLPLKLQAYERMALFLERISPNNMIHRIRKPNLSARELHLALVNSVRTEYEHNLSQQIYLSVETWELIKNVKEEIIAIVNHALQELPDSASGTELSKQIFEILIKNEQVLPTQKALVQLKIEVNKIY